MADRVATGCVVLEQVHDASLEPEFPISLWAGKLEARGIVVRRGRLRVDDAALGQPVRPDLLARVVAWLDAEKLSHVLLVRDYHVDLAEKIAGALPHLLVGQAGDEGFQSIDAIARWIQGDGAAPARDDARDPDSPDDIPWVVAAHDLTPDAAGRGFDGDLVLDDSLDLPAPATAEERAACLRRQLELHARDRPEARVFHLFDRHAVEHLDEIAGTVADAVAHPIELCIDVQVADVVRGLERIARGLDRLAPGGHVLDFYRAVITTFSPGVDEPGHPALENVECLARFDELARRYPGSFEWKRLRAHQLGLFAAGTSPDSLLRDAYFARALGVGRACAWHRPGVGLGDRLVERIASLWTRITVPDNERDLALCAKLEALLAPRAGDDWPALALAALVLEAEQADNHDDEAVLAGVEKQAHRSESELLSVRRLLGEGEGRAPWLLPATRDLTEIRLLEAGIKPAVKLELDDRDRAGEIEAELAAAGFATALVDTVRAPNRVREEGGDSSAFPIVLASRDPQILRALADRIDHAIESSAEEVAEVGRLLGYPRCCVEAYAKRADVASDDLRCLALAVAATEGVAEADLDPWAAWGMIEYVPCRMDCPASLERVHRAKQAGFSRPDSASRLAPQLVLSVGSRIVLEDAAPVPDGWTYKRSHAMGHAPHLSAFAEAIADGDRITITSRLALIWREGRLRHALPHDVMVPWAPGEPPRFSWLAAVGERLRVVEPERPVASVRLVHPDPASAATRTHFERAIRAAGSPAQLVGADGLGHAFLFDNDDYAFFRGKVLRHPEGIQVRLDALLDHRLREQRANAAAYSVLRAGAILRFDATGAAIAPPLPFRLGESCDVVTFCVAPPPQK